MKVYTFVYSKLVQERRWCYNRVHIENRSHDCDGMLCVVRSWDSDRFMSLRRDLNSTRRSTAVGVPIKCWPVKYVTIWASVWHVEINSTCYRLFMRDDWPWNSFGTNYIWYSEEKSAWVYACPLKLQFLWFSQNTSNLNKDCPYGILICCKVSVTIDQSVDIVTELLLLSNWDF